MKRFFANFWTVLKWALALLVAASVGAGVFVWNSFDDQLRAQVEARLAQHYRPQGLRVVVRRAQWVQGEGIVASGIRIAPANAAANDPPWFEADELRLGCTLAADELIHGDLPIHTIRVVRPTLRVARWPDGTWNAARLWPPPSCSRKDRAPPRLQIEDGTLVIAPFAKGVTAPLTLSRARLELSPVAANAIPSTSPSGASPAPAQPTPSRVFNLTAEAVGGPARLVSLAGQIDAEHKTCSLSGAILGLDVSAENTGCLLPELPPTLTPLKSLVGQASARFTIERNDPTQPPQFALEASLERGRIDDARLPEPVTDIQLQLIATNQRLEVRHATARCGAATLQIAGRREGWTDGVPLGASATIRNFAIDPRWMSALPESMHALWAKYSPEGQVDIDATASFDGQRWRREATVACNNLAISYYKLPYRVRQGTGTLKLQDDVLTTNLVVHAAGRPVRITGSTQNPGPHFTGWVELRGDNLNVDDELLNAMPEKAGKFLRALHPRGRFDVAAHFEKTDPEATSMRPRVALRVREGSVRYDHFPFQMDNVHGDLSMVDGKWSFDDLRADRIRCRGSLTPSLGEYRLDLHFAADNVPLDDRLYRALPPKVQPVWATLRPRGALDQLLVDVTYESERKKLDVAVAARKWPPSPQTADSAISIEPTWFPLRMDDVYGQVSYRNNRVTFHELRATHGRTQALITGVCNHDAEGGWQVQLDNLTAQRVAIDQELLTALPEPVRQGLTPLNLSGPIDLRGSLSLMREPGVGMPVTSRWDLTAGLSGNAIDCGVKLENMHGAVHLVGAHDPSRGTNHLGEIDLDAVSFKGLQFAQIRGPFDIQNDRVLFGSRARRLNPQQQPSGMTGNLFGGSLAAEAVITRENPARFWLQTQVNNADVDRYAREMMPGHQRMQGKVSLSSELWGSALGAHTLRGQGRLRFRDGDVYELPLMVSMLKMLSVRSPDSSAFSAADLDYRLEGTHFYFDRINFLGDAVSLLGKGEMDFERQVNLNFYAIVGRQEIQIPIVRPLLREASKQMMEIRVAGPVDNPRITSETFPGARQFLQQVNDDLVGASESQDILGPAREVLRKSGSRLK